MPLINLIQEQRYTLKRSEAKARSLFYGFIGVTAVSGLAFGFFFIEADIAARRTAELQSRIRKLEPVVRKIEDDEDAYAQIAPRVKILEGAQAMTEKWIGLMDHLSKQTPQNTWLTGLRSSALDATKPISVSFAGLSDKQELVGDLMLRLQNCPYLDDVALRYTQEKVIQQGSGIEFEIVATIVDSVEQAEKPKEDKAKS
jgi:Tfp pilus assembly protein PilN